MYFMNEVPTVLRKAPRTELPLRVAIELKEILQRLADEDGRSLNAYVNRVLEQHVTGP